MLKKRIETKVKAQVGNKLTKCGCCGKPMVMSQTKLSSVGRLEDLNGLCDECLSKQNVRTENR